MTQLALSRFGAVFTILSDLPLSSFCGTEKSVEPTGEASANSTKPENGISTLIAAGSPLRLLAMPTGIQAGCCRFVSATGILGAIKAF
jgi:hypothetical protein